ncbi:AcidPPc domain-containing protein [Aphelenchoides besseyi]|nr:AcidPPc domain-containing protein [Aphelenchoides besseyi]KAI6193261.1 AcidPPc domain-containing protein [Aphelenchoides besseyi]
MNVRLSIGRIVCDFLVLVVIAIPLLVFHEWVQPYKRGFYCDDESIRYPYRPSTVTRQALIVIGIMIPTILILFTEVFRTLAWERHQKHLFRSYGIGNHNVHRLIVRLYVFIGYFFVGVCFNQLMVDIAKYTIGRQRPHFIAVCQPSRGFRECPPNHEYIDNFECMGPDKYRIHESMLSFYSGHSAFSFYAAVYTSFYLQARLYRPLISRLVLPVIQFALFSGAAYVAYTRISDYKHHWSDVLVGSIFGSGIGIINAVCIANVFQRREIPHGVKRGFNYQMDPTGSPTAAHNNQVDVEHGNRVLHIPINRDGSLAGPTQVHEVHSVHTSSILPKPQEVRYSSVMHGDH